MANWNDLNRSAFGGPPSKPKSLLQQEFEKLIRKPLPVNIALDAPSLNFTISDLEEDPEKFEEQFKEYLEKIFTETVQISFQRAPIQAILGQPQIVQLPAKIKWSLATFEFSHSNEKWIAKIKVPLL